MITVRSFLLSLLAINGTLAAECYNNKRDPDVDYQTLAYRVCHYGPDQTQLVNGVFAEAHYEGNIKLNCEEAFANIFYQCIHDGGTNGGEWTWEYEGKKQKYWMQSFYVG
ncbi:hypothetical protein FDECE_11617 [Fusarium decemcellulare]|nr:hypothetical protein FDECE_11617 [Fusarium decemcellulare]